MVTAIPVVGNYIVQWLWGGYTVSKCGIRSYFFSGSSNTTAGQINESKIESNHSLFESYAGNKDFYD